MALSPTERAQTLSRWIKPSSDNEVEQQERAVRMVTEAINGWPAFEGVSRSIYAKGSYANNTNVRRDSDVDIVVECHALMHYDSHSAVVPKISKPAYEGKWNRDTWRQEIHAALAKKFGPGSLDASGQIAIEISAVEGSRPSIDVVPSFHFRRYDSADEQRFTDGSCVLPRSGGARIVNWPAQQLENGRKKNDRTHKRYKNYVRALKNAENYLAENGVINPKPSYLMECLVWNVTDPTLTFGDLDAGFRGTLIELWYGLDSNEHDAWVEPNMQKWLFKGPQKWTVADAKEVVLGTWKLMGYQ